MSFDTILQPVRRVMLRAPLVEIPGMGLLSVPAALDTIVSHPSINRCVLVAQVLRAAALADDACKQLVQDSGVINALKDEISARQSGQRPAALPLVRASHSAIPTPQAG